MRHIRSNESAARRPDVLAELMALRAMSVAQLREKWEALFDAPAPIGSRGNLELRLGYRIQELALVGLGRETRRTLDVLAEEVAAGKLGALVSDPRKPGAVHPRHQAGARMGG